MNGAEKLLKVIKNPISDHLPVGCKKIGLKYEMKKCLKMVDFARTLPVDEPVVYFIGAMAHGEYDVEALDEEISISEYPLSASTVCAKVCYAYEDVWGIY